MVTELRVLKASDFDAVHPAFLEAFSDYVVKLAPTAEQLRELLTRRAWVPELSVGAYDGDSLVAFTLNGFDGNRGYDSGTGVVPSHRRLGLARQTMEWSIARLHEAGATGYVLEVIESNAPAVALYHACGFEVVRRMQCWSFPRWQPAAPPGVGTIEPRWWDVEPSWQNSTASILRARDPHLILGNDAGYAVVFPYTGDLAQLAVAPAARRRGRGRALLNAAATAAGKPLRILNVDSRDEGIAAFFEACGAEKLVTQLEMVISC